VVAVRGCCCDCWLCDWEGKKEVKVVGVVRGCLVCVGANAVAGAIPLNKTATATEKDFIFMIFSSAVVGTEARSGVKTEMKYLR